MKLSTINYNHAENLHTRTGALVGMEKFLSEHAFSSLLDVGAGTGSWLAAARAHGVMEVVGVDGVLADESLIPADSLRKIFDRFYRVEQARTRTKGGSGLGLSLAKWIAEMHNGSIEAESELGKGSRFIVQLPLYTPPRQTS